MRHVQSFILNGQYGLSANGMRALASELIPFGTVTVLPWNDGGFIADYVFAHPNTPVAVIGFSLGANQLGHINTQLRTRGIRVALGVALDPSRQSPLVMSVAGEYVQSAEQFDRLICFYNPRTWYYGGAKYVGPNVELIEINSTHLGVPYLPGPRAHTIEAVRCLTDTVAATR